jgi:hypothetical protein
MNIVPQRAEIHIRALFDARYGTLGYAQDLGHFCLRQPLGTPEFIESHSL